MQEHVKIPLRGIVGNGRTHPYESEIRVVFDPPEVFGGCAVLHLVENKNVVIWILGNNSIYKVGATMQVIVSDDRYGR